MDRYAFNEELHLASKEQWRTIARTDKTDITVPPGGRCEIDSRTSSPEQLRFPRVTGE